MITKVVYKDDEGLLHLSDRSDNGRIRTAMSLVLKNNPTIRKSGITRLKNELKKQNKKFSDLCNIDDKSIKTMFWCIVKKVQKQKNNEIKVDDK